MNEDKKTSSFRMLIYLFEASVFSVLISGWPLNLALAIFLWPLALILLPLQFIFVLVFSPALVLVAWPLSIYLYKKRKDSPYIWIGCFFTIGYIYVQLIVYLQGAPAAEIGAAFVLQTTLAGLFMWMQLYKHRYKIPE